MNEVDIARINELYHKSKTTGLDEDEKKEQAALRQAYIDAVKGNIRSQMNNIDMVNADGSISNKGTELEKNGK